MVTEKVEEAAPEELKPTLADSEEEYDFHIKLHGENIDRKLKDAAAVAEGLGLIPKATLRNLTRLFIG